MTEDERFVGGVSFYKGCKNKIWARKKHMIKTMSGNMTKATRRGDMERYNEGYGRP